MSNLLEVDVDVRTVGVCGSACRGCSQAVSRNNPGRRGPARLGAGIDFI